LLATREGTEEGEGGVEVEASRPNTGSNVEVAKSPIFNREVSKVVDFVMACKLYIRMRMREMLVEE